ncbi:MAG: hypothetical protein WD449_01960, partial [Candidatus Babeliales bacterium]
MFKYNVYTGLLSCLIGSAALAMENSQTHDYPLPPILFPSGTFLPLREDLTLGDTTLTPACTSLDALKILENSLEGPRWKKLNILSSFLYFQNTFMKDIADHLIIIEKMIELEKQLEPLSNFVYDKKSQTHKRLYKYPTSTITIALLKYHDENVTAKKNKDLTTIHIADKTVQTWKNNPHKELQDFAKYCEINKEITEIYQKDQGYTQYILTSLHLAFNFFLPLFINKNFDHLTMPIITLSEIMYQKGSRLVKSMASKTFTNKWEPADFEEFKKIIKLSERYHESAQLYQTWYELIRQQLGKKVADGYQLRAHHDTVILPKQLEPLTQPQPTPNPKKGQLSQAREAFLNTIDGNQLPQKSKKTKKKKNYNQAIIPPSTMPSHHEQQENIAPLNLSKNHSYTYCADNSFTLEENDSVVTIKDPKNNCTIILYKIAPPEKTPKGNNLNTKLPYHTRVEQWFNSPRNALNTQGYCTKGSKKFTQKACHQTIIIHHNFAQAVDTYLPTLGIVTPWYGTKKSITIPGEIHCDNGQKSTVLFTYGITAEQHCFYHRSATIKPPDEIIG